MPKIRIRKHQIRKELFSLTEIEAPIPNFKEKNKPVHRHTIRKDIIIAQNDDEKGQPAEEK
jgi:hypothetical protein